MASSALIVVLVEGATSATAGFCSGWLSGFVVFFEGLCKSPTRTEASPPEMTIRSQRGMRMVILYTLERMVAK